MTMAGRRWLPFAFWAISLLAALPSRSEEPKLAISGYDTVAYFTDGKAVPGQSAYEYVWNDARWRFASAAHRDMFVQDPEHYAPQYDGYCAMGVASQEPHKDVPDPQSWIIVDGRVYLTHSQKALGLWRDHLADNIQRANREWAGVKQQTTIYDGYPNVQK
jgi:hypothetical protein